MYASMYRKLFYEAKRTALLLIIVVIYRDRGYDIYGMHHTQSALVPQTIIAVELLRNTRCWFVYISVSCTIPLTVPRCIAYFSSDARDVERGLFIEQVLKIHR